MHKTMMMTSILCLLHRFIPRFVCSIIVSVFCSASRQSGSVSITESLDDIISDDGNMLDQKVGM